MKRFLTSLFMGIVCGIIVFFTIIVLDTMLPSSGNLKIAAIAGIFTGTLEAVGVYYQNQKQQTNETQK